MADIAVRSTQNIHGNGVGYKPTNTKPTARYTVTKTITKTSDTLATVTMVITIKTNYEFVAVGLGETLTYQLVIDGVQRGSVVLKTATQTMNASGTYTRTLVAPNVPLDHRTTQPANLRLVNDKRSDWTFNSNTQGGDEIVGLPIGIQRSNFSSFSNFTVTDGAVSFSASVTRVSAGTTHDVSLYIGSTRIAFWEAQGNFTSLSLTQTQSRALLNLITTSTTATVQLRVQTMHGGSALYIQSRNATATVGISPSIGSVGISDSSGALTAVGALVQNISNVTLSISSVSAGYGATVSTYGYEWLGQTHSGQTSSTLNTGIVNQSGSQTFKGYMRNSRGQTATRSRTDTVLSWSAPRSTSVKVQRCTSTGALDPAGSYIRVTGSHSVSPLKVGTTNKNTMRVLVRYRIANSSTWTNALNKTYPAGTVSTSESHTLGGGALDPTKSYDFEVIAYDRYANTVVTGLIPTERVLISKVRNEGVGFGKIRERGIIDARGSVYIDGSLDTTNGLHVNGEAVIRNNGMLHVKDTRTVATPTNNGIGLDVEFKRNSVIGLESTQQYSTVITVQPWTDSSGGSIHQFALVRSDDTLTTGMIYYRSTPIGATTWGTWNRVLTEKSDATVGSVFAGTGSDLGASLEQAYTAGRFPANRQFFFVFSHGGYQYAISGFSSGTTVRAFLQHSVRTYSVVRLGSDNWAINEL